MKGNIGPSLYQGASGNPVGQSCPTDALFQRDCHPQVLLGVVLNFVSVQPSSTTLFRVPFPLPTLHARWTMQLWTMPERDSNAAPNNTRVCQQLWQPPLEVGVPGFQRCPNAKPPLIPGSLYPLSNSLSFPSRFSCIALRIRTCVI